MGASLPALPQSLKPPALLFNRAFLYPRNEISHHYLFISQPPKHKETARDEFAWESNIAQQRMNMHLANGVIEAEFIDFRRQRDKNLSLPRLFLPSVQINMRAGHFPEPASNGISYLLTSYKEFY